MIVHAAYVTQVGVLGAYTMFYEVVAMPLSTMHMTPCTRVKWDRVVSWILLYYYRNLSKICPWVMNFSGSINPQRGVWLYFREITVYRLIAMAIN